IVVLIDRNTASSAEILTAALADDAGAPVVGTRSFGKGVFQQEVDLSNGGALKLTIGEYFTPDRENLAGDGIEPDVRARDGPGTERDAPARPAPPTNARAAGEALLREELGRRGFRPPLENEARRAAETAEARSPRR